MLIAARDGIPILGTPQEKITQKTIAAIGDQR